MQRMSLLNCYHQYLKIRIRLKIISVFLFKKIMEKATNLLKQMYYSGKHQMDTFLIKIAQAYNKTVFALETNEEADELHNWNNIFAGLNENIQKECQNESFEEDLLEEKK